MCCMSSAYATRDMTFQSAASATSKPSNRYRGMLEACMKIHFYGQSTINSLDNSLLTNVDRQG
jgi:hypothetical protein